MVIVSSFMFAILIICLHGARVRAMNMGNNIARADKIVIKAAASIDAANGMSTLVKENSLSVNDRKKAALFGLYVGDATAMPVHWMYNLDNLRKDYGTISGYVKPKDNFQGSILNLSNTGGGGRGSDQGEIVGTVILHGKKKYWMRGGNFHYHLGLQAGESCFNIVVYLLSLKWNLSQARIR